MSALGLGCAKFGSVSSTIDSATGVRLLEEAFDLGITFFDTANIYGQGASEVMLGKTFRNRRDKVVITTKAGYTSPPKAVTLVKPLVRRIVHSSRQTNVLLERTRASTRRQNFSPKLLRSNLEASLRRLKTDYVDVFLLHSLPAELLEVEGPFVELQALKRDGLCRHVGISMIEIPPDSLTTIPACIEVIGSEIHSEAGPNLAALPALRHQGIGVVAYRPFRSGKGLETVTQSSSGRPPDRESRERHPTEQALRFALNQPGVATVVFGVSSIDQLKSNVAAVSLQ